MQRDMITKISLGLTPHEEDCVQVCSNHDYLPAMRQEARRYLGGLRKHFAKALEVSPNISFRITSQGHDFGSYLEVEILFDPGDPAQAAVAYHIEENSPGTWEELENESSNWIPESAGA